MERAIQKAKKIADWLYHHDRCSSIGNGNYQGRLTEKPVLELIELLRQDGLTYESNDGTFFPSERLKKMEDETFEATLSNRPDEHGGRILTFKWKDQDKPRRR